MQIRSKQCGFALTATAFLFFGDVVEAQTKPRITTLRGGQPPAAQPVQQPAQPSPKAQPAPAAATQPAPAPEANEEPTSPSPNVDAGERLDVMCFGAGSANKVDVINGYATHSTSGSFSTLDGTYGSYSGSGSSNATVLAPRSQDFADQVSLFIENGEGRVRMPRTMLPPVRGGKDGWFKLKDIKIKQNEITASVAVNIINNPKLRLDRYSGALSISGKAGDYAGMCRRIEPQKEERKF